MLSGISSLPYGASAHVVARREFFKRIRDSLHCVRRPRNGEPCCHISSNEYYWRRSSARRSITPNTASSAQARRKSNAKQRQDQNKPLPFEFDVAVVDSQWLTNTDKYRTFVSSFLSTALLPHVVLLLPLPLPASPPLALGTELSMLIAVQV